MPTLQLVRVHEADAVREIISEALAIAHEHENTYGMSEAVFGKAVDLLAARIPLQPVQASALDLGALGIRG